MKNIPKIAHFYWGNKVLPYLRYLTLYSFKKYNPDWKINLYVPKVLQSEMSWTSSEHKFTISCEDYSNRVEGLGIQVIPFDFDIIGVSNTVSEVLKSDFLRWYLLSTQGGLWSDMDILFFRPVSQISMDEKVSTVLCFHEGYYSVGFMMASSNNSIFKYLHDKVKSCFNPCAYQSIGRTLLDTSLKDVRKLCNRFPEIVHNLPMGVVYPVNWSKVGKVCTTNMNILKPESIGLHWYAGSQLLGYWINEVNENTYMKHDNVLCNLIQRIVQ